MQVCVVTVYIYIYIYVYIYICMCVCNVCTCIQQINRCRYDMQINSIHLDALPIKPRLCQSEWLTALQVHSQRVSPTPYAIDIGRFHAGFYIIDS